MQANAIKSKIAAALVEEEGIDIERCLVSHFSWLFFTQGRVYKVRRNQLPVVACQTELQNLAEKEFERGKLFSPSLYHGVKTVQIEGDIFKALILERIPDCRLLHNAYLTRTFNSDSYSSLIEGLNNLNKRSNIVKFRPLAEDLQLTLEFLDRAKERDQAPQFDYQLDIGKEVLRLRRFFDNHAEVFHERMKAGRVLDTHGDLHSANIFIGQEAAFVDPAVASSHMYQLDYLNQIADVILDLVVFHYEPFVPQLMNDVVVTSSDQDSRFLLSRFFLPLRALIRIAVWRLYGNEVPASFPLSYSQLYFDLLSEKSIVQLDRLWAS